MSKQRVNLSIPEGVTIDSLHVSRDLRRSWRRLARPALVEWRMVGGMIVCSEWIVAQAGESGMELEENCANPIYSSRVG